MIRVLHSVSNMDRGGIETMLMNYYRHIDREKVQFDFIVNKQKPGDYDDEIRRLGGHIYQSPGLNPLHYPAYLRFVQQTVAADPRIRILHAHNEAMGLYALKGAEKAGLQVRIAHAHNIWIVRDYKWPLKMFCKQLLPGAATHLWACGRDAGIYYFGKADWEHRGQIIPNAIEPETLCPPALRVCRWWGSRRKPLGWGAYFRTQCRRRCCFLPMPSRSRFPPAMQTGQQACSGCSTSPVTALPVQN